MCTTRYLHRSLLAVAVILSTGAAIAADKPAAASGKLLTRDELRACMKQEQSNKARSAEVVRLQAELDAAKAEIKTMDAGLKAKAATVDAADEAAVNALKAEAQTLDERIDTYNQRLPAFNQQTEALRADQADYKSRCADRKYDEKDYFAIKRGK